MYIYTHIHAYIHRFWHTVSANTAAMDKNLCLRVAQTPRNCGLHHVLTHSLWEHIEEPFTTCGQISALFSRLSPLPWHPRPRNFLLETGQGIELCSFSPQQQGMDFGGLIHQPKVQDTKESKHPPDGSTVI